MKKNILVSVDRSETRVAVLEAKGSPIEGKRRKKASPSNEWKVAELYVERRGRRSIVGNIYKGKVDNVLPGLEAAFVDIGLDKNGFLHVDEIVIPGVEVARRGRLGSKGKSIGELLKPLIGKNGTIFMLVKRTGQVGFTTAENKQLTGVEIRPVQAPMTFAGWPAAAWSSLRARAEEAAGLAARQLTSARVSVVVLEQVRDRLDQVDEPDAGEEPAQRAAGTGHVTVAEPDGEQARPGPVRLVADGFGGSCRHRSLTSLQCCHVPLD